MKLTMLIVIALLAVAVFAVPAPAQEAEVVVTVPFEFIAGTQMLPAGEYTVSRTESLASSALLLSSRDGGTFLLPAAFDDIQAGDARLGFDQIGAEHVLSYIQTPSGTYTIDNRREEKRLTKMAQSNDHVKPNAMTSSGAQ